MVKKSIIQEIWIINNSGITLYNQSIESNKNSQKKVLIGSFMSSINQMAKTIEMGEFQNIKIGKNRISFLHYKTELMFVCKSDINTKENKVMSYIDNLKEKFVTHYSEKLLNWDGDISIFDNMDGIINLRTDGANFLGIELNRSKSKDIISKL